MTTNSKIKTVQNKNSKFKMAMIIIYISTTIIALVLLSSFIFKIYSANNDNETANKQDISLAGIYRGDGTYKECTPGIICRAGWSSNSYMRLNEDGTCYTNMSLFIGTGAKESSCQWHVEDEARRYIIFEFPDLNSIHHTGMGDKAKRGGNYEEDGSLVILNAYLRKEE